MCKIQYRPLKDATNIKKVSITKLIDNALAVNVLTIFKELLFSNVCVKAGVLFSTEKSNFELVENAQTNDKKNHQN